MSESDTTEQPVRHTAGAFDVRTFIAALMGIFGVILVLAGIFGSDTTTTGTKTPGNANLWVGIALVVFAVLMQGWAMLRPTIVDEAELAKQKAEAEEMGGHSAH
ncbi:hypothetical protein GCM10011519_09010 [Marmoricola endophyticus]|uniref:Uncharacterized protein n=1 Tax=Marmoricola endophyticus TaxID=2040280 RepID=A0A917BD05_9ACTN|nr:hypothetical protein [Marmoricola endophyticus]GGF37645.1 hypothetical protein GCM10011519_09010 [Marmoricola endophyticus]